MGERVAALAVTNIMKAKSKLGMGYSEKRNNTRRKIRRINEKKKGGFIPFRTIVAAAKKSMIKSKNAKEVISSAIKAARKAVKKKGGKNKVDKVRVLPLPYKTGGVLPLVPIFAGLSALGALAGGASGVAKAINDSIAAKKQLEESKRHNEAMEQVALGNGLYLRPYKIGNGLRLYNENIIVGRKKKLHKFTIEGSH